MLAIHCEAKISAKDKSEKIGPLAVITLPKDASTKLPSRGMTCVEGFIKDYNFCVVLQPDGQGSHWFGIDKTFREATGIDVGDTVCLKITPSKVWPEPEISKDLKAALTSDSEANTRWKDITPMARWDWINWMGSVKLPKTLQERPEKLCSMLKAGKRRPCCFNRSLQMPPKCAELL